jgi:purine-binding chemotaxis protein CheW
MTEDAQFVTLGIDSEVYAVPVASVVEILDMRPVFRIPETPPYLSGLIDVRGRGVPVIDLRMKLGLSGTTATENTRILVLEVPVAGRVIVLGLIADRVFEVMPLNLRQLEAPPDIGVAWRSDYIRGVGRRGNGFVIVFDLARLFSTEEVVLLSRKPRAEPVTSARETAPAVAEAILDGPELPAPEAVAEMSPETAAAPPELSTEPPTTAASMATKPGARRTARGGTGRGATRNRSEEPASAMSRLPEAGSPE